MLATARGHKDKLFQIKWSPFDETHLVTVGMKHIKFWAQVGKEERTRLIECVICSTTIVV